MAAAGGKRIVITPESAQVVARALNAYADYLGRPTGQHPTFMLVGRAAYDEVIQPRSCYRVTLRAGIRVIAEYESSDQGNL